MGDALSAKGAVRFFNPAAAGNVHRRAGARVGDVPNVHILYLIAYLDTPHALDALIRVAHEREVLRPVCLDEFLFEALIDNIQIVGEILQRTIAASHAGGAVRVVLGEDKLYVDFAGVADFGTVGVDLHSLFHFVIAGGNEFLLALDLHHADAAGADLVDIFQKAKGGNRYARGGGGV